jgi:hypothetical protein
MRSAWWLLLLMVIALACASAILSNALRTEAGRKRLLPVLGPLMRVINSRLVHAVEKGESTFGLVHHIWRRSGVVHETPVDVARTRDGVLISLPYGPETNWCRNVVAAQHCTLTLDGEELALTAQRFYLQNMPRHRCRGRS